MVTNTPHGRIRLSRPGGATRRPAGLAALAAAVVMLATTLVVLAPPEVAEATHFRANQTSWIRTGPTTVQFTVTTSYRASYFAGKGVGDTFTDSDILYFGDGTSEVVTFTAIALDSVNDVITGRAVVSHTYPSTSDQYWAELSNCCRLSAPLHKNNPDGSFIWKSLVDLSLSGSPVSAIPPIVDCPENAVCTFTVPVSSPDGGPYQYRLAGSGDGFGTQPPGATVNPNTGQYSWDTTGASVNPPPMATFYSTAVVIEKYNSAGQLIASTIVDFFIRIGGSGLGEAPHFVAPTPADGSTLTVELGDTLTFDVAAHDEDDDVINLDILNKPDAATYVQDATDPGEATATFTWTPNALETTFVTLTAMDSTGLSAVQRSITINVVERTTPPTTDPPPTNPPPTVPPTTAPPTTAPSTTVPETTVPETTMPETTVPQTTVTTTRPTTTTRPATRPATQAPAATPVRAQPALTG